MDERVSIRADDDGQFDGFLCRPPVERAPGLVMIPEIFGINQAMRETARRYADEGFVVLALDMFWRLDRNVDLGYDEASYERAFAYHRAFDYGIGARDVQAAIQHLRTRPECNSRVGVVGFCLGGTMAYLAAARSNAEAAVGYYATRIQNFLDDASRINRPLILHFPEHDHTTPPEIMARILPVIAENKYVTSYIHKGVGHGFANHRRPDTYDEATTRIADERTFAFFRKWLSAS